MRLTKDLLYKYAQETVKQRKRSEPDLHAAYLIGSALGDDPLVGGTTDIDLVLVHKYQAPKERECLPLTSELSLDIIHKIKDDYTQHRQLRHDPWLGYPLTHNHILLYDTDHWLEFIQAGVSADFHRSDNVLARVNFHLSTARENWFSLMQTTFQNHLEWLQMYLETLSLAANAISGLIGPPLTPRRFISTLQERTDTLGVPKVLAGFNGLLGFANDDPSKLTRWIDTFEKDLAHLAQSNHFPAHLDPCRHLYYLSAMRGMLEDGPPEHTNWLLLKTWLDVQTAAPQPSPEVKVWEDFLKTLSLTEKNTAQKTEAMDSYLDNIEIIIETWAETYG